MSVKPVESISILIAATSLIVAIIQLNHDVSTSQEAKNLQASNHLIIKAPPNQIQKHQAKRPLSSLTIKLYKTNRSGVHK